MKIYKPTIIIDVELTKEEINSLDEAISTIDEILYFMRDNNCSTAICEDYDEDITYELDTLEEVTRILGKLGSLYKIS